MSTWKASIASNATVENAGAAKDAGRDSVSAPVVITVYEKTQKLRQLDEFSLEILGDEESGADPYNRNCR